MKLDITWKGIPLTIDGELDEGDEYLGQSDSFLVYEIWHETHRQVGLECLEDPVLEIEELCLQKLADDAAMDSEP